MEMFNILYSDASRLREQPVRSRLALRKNLKCNDFEWYLNNVWPEVSQLIFHSLILFSVNKKIN